MPSQIIKLNVLLKFWQIDHSQPIRDNGLNVCPSVVFFFAYKCTVRIVTSTFLASHYPITLLCYAIILLLKLWFCCACSYQISVINFCRLQLAVQETLPQLKTHELPQNCFSLSSMCIQLSHLQYGTHVHDLYRVRERAYAYLISEFVHLATYFCVHYPATLHSECCIPAFYLFVGHCCRATWRVVPACLSLFAKSLGTCFDCIQQPFIH